MNAPARLAKAGRVSLASPTATVGPAVMPAALVPVGEESMEGIGYTVGTPEAVAPDAPFEPAAPLVGDVFPEP